MAIARDVEDDQERHASEKLLLQASWSEVLKRAFLWFLIRILLLAGLLAIAAAGGWAFMTLEQPNELSLCYGSSSAYQTLEDDSVDQLWSIGQSYFLDTANGDLASTQTQTNDAADAFANGIISLSNFDGRNCSLMGTPDGVEFKWNMYGALLFATTIFTTVGYGNIAPVTYWGRILCFAYGMISIPYMLWCLSIMGELMADIFNFMYVNICCLGICARRGRRRKRAAILEANKKRIREEMMEQKLSATGIPTSWKELYEAREDEMNKAAKALMADVDDEEEEDDEIAIPLSVTLMVVFSYVIFGTVLFGVWEDWETLSAAYFCFVTISTIGFGDIVPGTAGKAVTAPTSTLKLTVCAIYSIVGMAIISMAFSLIQENISKKAKAIQDKINNLKANPDDQGNPGDGQPSMSDNYTMPQATFPTMTASSGLGPASFPFGFPPAGGEHWTEQSNNTPIESLAPSEGSGHSQKSASLSRRERATGGDDTGATPRPDVRETSFSKPA